MRVDKYTKSADLFDIYGPDIIMKSHSDNGYTEILEVQWNNRLSKDILPVRVSLSWYGVRHYSDGNFNFHLILTF